MAKCLLCVALPCEARPLIDHFQLKIEQQTHFRTYTSSDIVLVETGVGKLNAAAATAATLTALQHNFAACINVGIAGADRHIGTVCYAESIEDGATKKKWYPQPNWKPPGEGIAVKTVDKPENQYTAKSAFDMEAAGFMSAAIKFTTLEFIQCIKVISDNPKQDFTNIKPAFVSKLIGTHVELIEQAINRLLDLRGMLAETQDTQEMIRQFTKQHRVSVTQKHLLQSLLQQHHACFGKLPVSSELPLYSNTKELIRWLESSIANAPRRY